jgi:hypothetical protein
MRIFSSIRYSLRKNDDEAPEPKGHMHTQQETGLHSLEARANQSLFIRILENVNNCSDQKLLHENQKEAFYCLVSLSGCSCDLRRFRGKA